MRLVIIGGTGLIGSQVVRLLTNQGHEAVAASPRSGVDTLTGAGLAEAFAGADVVVDLTNSPSFADDDVMSFFVTSTTNQLRAEQAAGVRHHVALSVVGTGRLPDSGYLRAKAAQERLIAEAGVPFSIVHATQFFEFTRAIADASTVDGQLRLAPVHYQPMASADVASAVARVAVGDPLGGILEIGGPERVRMDEFIPAALAAAGDPRPVVSDVHATYFGTELDDDSLVPGPDAELGTLTYDVWAKASA
ncbi:SDR family oxidoreductase [Angustibacter sp. Root456]|uniref:SDR family oxidoreductase n=1 Tax=Angustibacter sp. Root456 TaxID=1736539 RepID=UPI0006FEDA77|nr:SDR family oxidoreductase [Angustibacter sp. Root456]KQX62871.1 NmrA family transcriptional regulator [Angustibacter sp. Root456]